jgi:hypothetical protein
VSEKAPVVRVEVPAQASMVQLLRTTAVSLAPPTTDVDRLSDLALAVSEAAGELLRLDGVSRVNMRIDERPQEMRAALTVAAPIPESWIHSWNRSISALVLKSVVEEVRAETNGEQAEIRFLFRPKLAVAAQ